MQNFLMGSSLIAGSALVLKEGEGFFRAGGVERGEKERGKRLS